MADEAHDDRRQAPDRPNSLAVATALYLLSIRP